MFTLRRFNSQGVEMNQILGESYTFIHRQINPEQFRASFHTHFCKPHVADLDETADDDTKRVYAFVFDTNGAAYPLYKNQKAYIMTENGNTFSNVSHH